MQVQASNRARSQEVHRGLSRGRRHFVEAVEDPHGPRTSQRDRRGPYTVRRGRLGPSRRPQVCTAHLIPKSQKPKAKGQKQKRESKIQNQKCQNLNKADIYRFNKISTGLF
ncbi:hypothetical protein M885DRAFT_110128 [Pelagophyceae sp. CCMP2097]|nr:hypothetical protein M885DRAFT_110128 [Pelagophyceae sp. CCMP2097]